MTYDILYNILSPVFADGIKAIVTSVDCSSGGDLPSIELKPLKKGNGIDIKVDLRNTQPSLTTAKKNEE